MKPITIRIFICFAVLGISSASLTADLVKLSPHVTLIQDAVNGVSIQKADHRLIIYGDPTAKTSNADMVLFTHPRRDIVWSGRFLVEMGAQ